MHCPDSAQPCRCESAISYPLLRRGVKDFGITSSAEVENYTITVMARVLSAACRAEYDILVRAAAPQLTKAVEGLTRTRTQAPCSQAQLFRHLPPSESYSSDPMKNTHKPQFCPFRKHCSTSSVAVLSAFLMLQPLWRGDPTYSYFIATSEL